MRVFLDTNVIVSAVATRGLCADVLRTVLTEHELVTSPRVLMEARRILRSKFSVPDALVAGLLELMKEEAVVAQAEDLLPLPIEDKDDVEIVSAAVSARTRILVTGDREVQGIKSVRNMRILSPRAFWDELTAHKA